MSHGAPLAISFDHRHLAKPELDRWKAAQQAHAPVPHGPTFDQKSMNGQEEVVELELELIQSQMAQKPMLRGEVGARAWRV